MGRTLEERIALFERSDIYPVVSSEFCGGRNPLEIVEGIGAAGAGIVQIREKHLPDRALLELVGRCLEVTRRYGMLLIVDDRLDIALAAGADGVHLGQDDLPLQAARAIAPEMLIGISTHNEAEIEEALAGGCSYLNMGPMFPTQTKSVVCGALGLEKIEVLKRRVKCPFSVMGGIKEHHLAMLVERGYRHIAMVTEITRAPDVREKVRALRQIMLGGGRNVQTG